LKIPVLQGITAERRKLLPAQVDFILACVTLDYEQRRAAGHKRRQKGLYKRLAGYFGVQPECIKKIALRQRWRTVPLPHLYKISERSRSDV
jgi:hypothetical protein